MADTEYTATLQILIAKIDTQTELLTKINGYVRDHGEQLASHKQWIWGHKQTHEALDKRVHTLSSWLWGLYGGTGILTTIFTIIQSIRL